ncbi:MAG: hypothetical protein AMXMBFR66_00270 [Pseudomonadota bacterium]
MLRRAGPHLAVAAATAAAYALLGLGALLLAGPPGYAAPLYPAAGLALAAVIVYGRAALPGVLVGAFAANASLGWLRGMQGLPLAWVPLLIGIGAAAQAALGAWLARRYAGTPLVLDLPRDIARFALLAAGAACTLSPSVATLALTLAGVLDGARAPDNWVTWWLGDTLGVLIGAPLVLTLIGQPRADWRARRRTLSLPLLVALALLAAAIVAIDREEHVIERKALEHRVDRLALEVQERLQLPLFALHALHAAVLAAEPTRRPSERTLHSASAWWLQQPWRPRALGFSERVPRAGLAAYEARARAEGSPGFRVFQRDGGSALAADGEAVVLRRIEPLAGNAGALGVNALSIPAARAAILATRDSGQPAATAGFGLTQSSRDETGIVLYQALYDGEPQDAAARAGAFVGVVFVALGTEALLADLAPFTTEVAAAGGNALHWCLLDTDPGAGRVRLAGNMPCPAAAAPASLRARRPIAFGGRSLELQVRLAPGTPEQAKPDLWFLALAGLAATALLGALLLTVTGHTRRTELAVEAATAEQRREIGERRQVEQALRDSEARLRSILNHTPLGVAFLDPEGALLDGNPGLYAMLGIAPAALRGRIMARTVHEDDRAALRQDYRELVAGHRALLRRQLRLVRADGSALPARIVAGPLRDDSGGVTHAVAVVEDIGEHLRLEEAERAVARAEAASRAKSEFLSRMSHELRTPLNAMIGFAQLLALDKEAPLAPRQHDWAQQIQRAGWHLLELINETLDLARIEAGTLRLTRTAVDLAALAGSCRELLAAAAAQRGLQFVEELAADLPPALADETRLRQVLTNLLSNAVKYNREGGSVTLRAHADADGSRLRLEVADSGIGMTETQLAGLFQPYNRLGREAGGVEGIGIGLVISRHLTELMGGELTVRSRAGAGTTFTLTLPTAGPDSAADAPDPTPTAGPGARYRQRRVLYVEDNETNAEIMRGLLLQRPQIRLEVATLGLDALQAARRQRPDLILLDMQLPDISGLELLRHFKNDDDVAGIPVIVVSADATAARMQQALTLGALHYVTKPLELNRFLMVIDEVLEGLETQWTS